MVVANAKFRWSAAFAILALWSASLALPAAVLTFDSGANTVVFRGYQMLETGYFGLAWFQPAWLANFAILSVVLTLTSSSFSRRFLLIAGVTAIVLALASLDMIIRPRFNGLVSLEAGYFLWMAASLTAFTSAAIVSRKFGSNE